MRRKDVYKRQVYDESGKPVARGEGKEGCLKIENVHLWEVHNAYLYHFVLKVLDGEEVLDEYYDEIGIRTFAVEGNRFLLNGNPVYLKGFGKHEDSDIVGRGFNICLLYTSGAGQVADHNRSDAGSGDCG